MSPDANAAQRIVEVEELLMQPGTYFNPQPEVVVVVDDSTSIDQEVFNMEAFEGADWVRIADEVPIDEGRRDELLEDFQANLHGGDGRQVGAEAIEDGDEPELEPDLEPDEE